MGSERPEQRENQRVSNDARQAQATGEAGAGHCQTYGRSTPRLRVAILGWGAIGQAVASYITQAAEVLPVSSAATSEAVPEGVAPGTSTEPGASSELYSRDIEIAAVCVRDKSAARSEIPAGATVIDHPSELAGLGIDVLAEAAGVASVKPWAAGALQAGIDVIVSSVAAFADAHLLEDLAETAKKNRAQLLIQTGALGGIDALSSAKLMGVSQVEHRMVKPPKAWLGTPAQDLLDLQNLVERVVFFSGNATEAAQQFPKNANVAMTTALAGIGPKNTVISLIADPEADGNSHEIEASGAFGEMSMRIRNNALPSNPKSSAMAALNLVRAIRNRALAIAI